ncbi:hypothetical protein [Burkholderia stagnalis]|uniref:hypothetical protein n=1 Tax=Burkholderia stagnalis TaxID=1503054 RepID=UPI0012D9EE41|nr:hypothetical protein [Burkholderia stagnalis]
MIRAAAPATRDACAADAALSQPERFAIDANRSSILPICDARLHLSHRFSRTKRARHYRRIRVRAWPGISRRIKPLRPAPGRGIIIAAPE